MSLKYVDSFSYKSHHQQINASLLMILQEIYDGKIEYVGAKKSLSVLLRYDGLNHRDIETRLYFQLDGKGRLHLVYRYLHSALINIWTLLRSNKNDVLFYNFNNVFSSSIINCLNKILKRKIIIVCHGEMELLLPDSPKRGALQRLIRKKICGFFRQTRKISESLFFVVLGDSILYNLQNILLHDQFKHFMSIDHPYIFPKHKIINKHLSKNRISVGTVGALSIDKGSHDLLKLSHLYENDMHKQVEIHAIGQIHDSYKDLLDAGVMIPKQTGKPIPENIYNTLIEQLDCILFFYPRNSYKLTASGALFEAILHHKQVIAYRNDYFEYLIKKYSIPCRFVNNIEEMKIEIDRIEDINDDIFSDIETKLSPLAIAEDVIHKFEVLGILR